MCFSSQVFLAGHWTHNTHMTRMMNKEEEPTKERKEGMKICGEGECVFEKERGTTHTRERESLTKRLLPNTLTQQPKNGERNHRSRTNGWTIEKKFKLPETGRAKLHRPSTLYSFSFHSLLSLFQSFSRFFSLKTCGGRIEGGKREEFQRV